MELTLKQTVKAVGVAAYEVIIEHEDKPSDVFNYTQSNKVYPVYQSLTAALRGYKNARVRVLTNSPVIVEEYNAERENNFTSLLTTLVLVTERHNIDLSIELAA